MTYQVEFKHEGTGFHLTGFATVLGSEIIAAAAEAHRDEARARRLRYALVDLADLTEFRVATEEVRLIVAEDMITARLAPRIVVAIVAPRDYAFGMARMWQVFAEDTGWTTQVFRGRAEAIEWLRENSVWPE